MGGGLKMETKIVYEDETEWLQKALQARDKQIIDNFFVKGIQKKPRWKILGSLTLNEEFLYDFMMWLKYGDNPR